MKRTVVLPHVGMRFTGKTMNAGPISLHAHLAVLSINDCEQLFARYQQLISPQHALSAAQYMSLCKEKYGFDYP